MTNSSNSSMTNKKPVQIPAANKASNEPKGAPFDTRRVPQELWAAILNYSREDCLISFGDYRLVCRNFNAAINSLIWNHVSLHIVRFDPREFFDYRAIRYDHSPLKLDEIRTMEEIVEQAMKEKNVFRTAQTLLARVYTEYLTRGVKYNETIAENLRKPSREVRAQIDKAWGPNRKSDKKTAAKISHLIKNFSIDGYYTGCNYGASLSKWQLKHACHFVKRHIEHIRTVSIFIMSDPTEVNGPYSLRLLDMAVELATAPGLTKVEFSVGDADDGSLADTILKTFRGRQDVDFKFDLSPDGAAATANLLEKLKPFDRPTRTTAGFTVFRSGFFGEGQINFAPFKSLRKLELGRGRIPSNWINALSACPNLTDLEFELTSVAYEEFDHVLQLPDNIEKIRFTDSMGELRSVTSTITGRGVKVLDLRMCISLKTTLNLPSLETLIIRQNSLSPSPLVSQLMEQRHKVGQIRALWFEDSKTDQLVQLLNHFRPSESLYFTHEGTFMYDYLAENILAFVPGGPGLNGLEQLNGDGYFHSDDDDFDDDDDCAERVEEDKFNIMQMASLWKCNWLPPQVVLWCYYEYSEGWHSVIKQFASLPRVSQLFVDFAGGLNRLPRHFYGPYRLTEDWCKNFHTLRSFIYVDKKIAEDKTVKGPRVVAKCFK
ncbi:hypothetical protein TRVA0_024S01596 [Trichomonascus vanleenenianus]|uniref:uncharacterized protein n=1 Tax=Trichomonascus vanleenenianus TaxID=2268995 RepID=UPI003ECB9558